MRASACASPGKAEGGTGSPPAQKKKKNRGGRGGGAKTAHSHETARQHHGRRPSPPPEGTEDRTPKNAQGDHPAKTGNTKPGTAAHQGKGTPKQADTHHERKKKETAAQPETKGMGGQGPQGPGQGHPEKKTKSAKNTSRQPSQKRLGTAETRAQHTRPHQNRKRRGTSGAPMQPHTSDKQAETEPNPRTPQTADTRGTTPQTVPKHTNPRPQPGLAGLTKPTPNRKPDPNTNAAQQ